MKKSKEYYITVREHAKQTLNRRGFPISESYLYRLIREHKAGIRNALPFDFVEVDQNILIVKSTSIK